MAPKKRKSTKEKEKVDATSEDEFYYQTVRILANDPDATESSSDEQVQKPNPSKPLPPKRILCEFVQPNPEIVKKLPQKQGLWRRFSTSIYKGVRRLRGKKERYAAQIRNPFEKTTEYLGTHDTEYEAALAYRRKTKEFHKRKVADSNKDRQGLAHSSPELIICTLLNYYYY